MLSGHIRARCSTTVKIERGAVTLKEDCRQTYQQLNLTLTSRHNSLTQLLWQLQCFAARRLHGLDRQTDFPFWFTFLHICIHTRARVSYIHIHTNIYIYPCRLSCTLVTTSIAEDGKRYSFWSGGSLFYTNMANRQIKLYFSSCLLLEPCGVRKIFVTM
jgi:hypothetical protein